MVTTAMKKSDKIMSWEVDSYQIKLGSSQLDGFS